MSVLSFQGLRNYSMSNPTHNGVGGLYIMWAEGLQRGLQLLGSAPGTSSVQSSASLLPDSLRMFVPEYRDTKYMWCPSKYT